MSTLWYYEYEVLYWNDTDHLKEILSGVISAETYADATKDLESYYGDGLMEIHMLKPIVEGTVFEFQNVMDDSSFNFTINRKL